MTTKTTDVENRTPAISIGLPVYNGEQFLREALDSLLGQSFTDFELILSDNASSDQTETICREYAARDGRIRYIRQEKNLGAAGNFAFVLKAARAPYFMWAAADDVWDARWIEVLLPRVQAKNCVAFGRVRTIGIASEPLDHPANDRRFSFGGPRLWRRMRFYLAPAFQGKANTIYGIYPRDSITDHVFERLAAQGHGSDTLMMYRVLETTPILHGGAVYISKRKHPGNLSESQGVDPNKTHARKPMFRRTQLPQLLEDSSFIESAALIGLYPVALILITPQKIAFQVARAIRRKRNRTAG